MTLADVWTDKRRTTLRAFAFCHPDRREGSVLNTGEFSRVIRNDRWRLSGRSSRHGLAEVGRGVIYWSENCTLVAGYHCRFSML